MTDRLSEIEQAYNEPCTGYPDNIEMEQIGWLIAEVKRLRRVLNEHCPDCQAIFNDED